MEVGTLHQSINLSVSHGELTRILAIPTNCRRPAACLPS